MSRVEQVTVSTTARLHMGFLDMHGGLGRCFGSLGLSLSAPLLRLRAQRAQRDCITGPAAPRAGEIVRSLRQKQGCAGVKLQVEQMLPQHAGLGSGTQLSLAVGTAMLRLYRKHLSLEDLAELLGRGARSGIGVATFAGGGLLLDGGSKQAGRVPPILCRLSFPQDWALLLIQDPRREGWSGAEEKRRFMALEPMKEQLTASLCRLMLMRLLPALQERNCSEFGTAVTELQQRIGEYFFQVQGGMFSSPEVAEAAAWLHHQGAAGYGQSSWGPTGFVLYPSQAQASQAQQQARWRWPQLDFCPVAGCNRGARVDCAGPQGAWSA